MSTRVGASSPRASRSGVVVVYGGPFGLHKRSAEIASPDTSFASYRSGFVCLRLARKVA